MSVKQPQSNVWPMQPNVWRYPTPRLSKPVPTSSRNNELLASLAQYDPIYLEEMQGVALLNRVEVKYVLPRKLLPHLLNVLRTEYDVLEVGEQRLNRYRTLYFDTADFALYRRHHAGAADRFKVRSRTYVDSQSSFLEVKHKTNKKRVHKSRIQTPAMITALAGDTAGFVADACPYDAETMLPRLWNSYRRITLVDKMRSERVTLDVDLRFDWDNRSNVLPHVVVAEVKQERFSHSSKFMDAMRQHHIRSVGFSKYCMGASLLYPELKQNRFKNRHRLLAKLATYEIPSTRGGYGELY